MYLGYHAVKKSHPLDLIAEPVAVHIPADKSAIRRVSCGRAHTLLLTESGTVLTLGHNGYGQCGRPIVASEDYKCQSTIHSIQIDEKISSVCCGQDHGC